MCGLFSPHTNACAMYGLSPEALLDRHRRDELPVLELVDLANTPRDEEEAVLVEAPEIPGPDRAVGALHRARLRRGGRGTRTSPPGVWMTISPRRRRPRRRRSCRSRCARPASGLPDGAELRRRRGGSRLRSRRSRSARTPRTSRCRGTRRTPATSFERAAAPEMPWRSEPPRPSRIFGKRTLRATRRATRSRLRRRSPARFFFSAAIGRVEEPANGRGLVGQPLLDDVVEGVPHAGDARRSVVGCVSRSASPSLSNELRSAAQAPNCAPKRSSQNPPTWAHGRIEMLRSARG